MKRLLAFVFAAGALWASDVQQPVRGATWTSLLGDFWVVRTSATVLTIGPNCSVAYPCRILFGSAHYDITAPATATLQAGAADSTVYIYMTDAGVLTVGHNSGDGKIVCASCTATNGVVAFPDTTEFDLWTWTVATEAYPVGGGTDVRTVIQKGAPFDARYWVSANGTTEKGLKNPVNLGALSTGLTKITVAGGVATPSAVSSVRSIGYPFDASGATLTAGATVYFTVPFACTISGWNILVDAGTATFKTWKIASGTAIPTVANSISTAGVAISSGTAVRSTTVTDFTTTAVAANDILAFNLFAVATATYAYFGLECTQ